MDIEEGVRRILLEEYKKIQTLNSSYSLRSFARHLNMSPATLTQFLKGKRPASKKFIKAVVTAYPDNAVTKLLNLSGDR